MAKFDSSEVLALMKRRGFVPAAQGTFTPAEFLAACSEEINSHIVPKIVELQVKLLLLTRDEPLVADQQAYWLPPRCVGGGIYAISYVDSAGKVSEIHEIDPGDVAKYGFNDNARGAPTHYAFEGGRILLYPTPGAGGSLRFKYYARPNRLVVSTGGLISSVTPASPASSGIASCVITGADSGMVLCDLVRGRGGFEHIAVDVACSVAGSTVTFTTPVKGLAVGDYVRVVEETCFPQLPVELHLPAAMRGVASILGAKGDRVSAAWLVSEAEKKESEILDSMSPRNKNEAADMDNHNWF